MYVLHDESGRLVARDLSHDHKPDGPGERQRIESNGGVVAPSRMPDKVVERAHGGAGGSASTPAALVVDLLRSYCGVLLSITASTTLLPILDMLPVELDRLVAAAVQPSTAAIWADIRAAGQRKLAAVQHAFSWAGELQQTIVHMPSCNSLHVTILILQQEHAIV